VIQLGRTTHRFAAALAGRLDPPYSVVGRRPGLAGRSGATLDFYAAARAAGALAD